jgi:hypothetical protein
MEGFLCWDSDDMLLSTATTSEPSFPPPPPPPLPPLRLRQEMWKEVREQVAEEVREEVRGNIMLEVREQVTEHVMHEVGFSRVWLQMIHAFPMSLSLTLSRVHTYTRLLCYGRGPGGAPTLFTELGSPTTSSQTSQ